jgi:antitoxin component HigA of HigAB toxin-antitoxin module
MLRALVGKRGAAVRDYKAVLLSLIVDYESSAVLRLDTSKVTASDVVLHLLEERGTSVNALSKVVGISQSSLSDMLNVRRDWSKQAIIRLSSYFGLQPGLFLKMTARRFPMIILPAHRLAIWRSTGPSPSVRRRHVPSPILRIHRADF